MLVASSTLSDPIEWSTEEKEMLNIVYALTNQAMPGFVKIGMTGKADVQERMKSLYSTGVPLPFECAVAWEIDGMDAGALEKELHVAFAPQRVNKSREFFKIDPEQVRVFLRERPGRDVTPTKSEQSRGIESQDLEALSKYKRNRTRTSEREFLEWLGQPMRRVYERVLDLGKADGMEVEWRPRTFSLNVVANGQSVGICQGNHPDHFHGALFTKFAEIQERTNVPPDVIGILRNKALEAGLFVPMPWGRRDELKCATDQELDGSQLTSLVDWLTLVIISIRENEEDTRTPTE